MPLGRHRLTIEELNATARRVQSDESSALVRSWRHLITVEPRGSGGCRYTDVVEIDAGPLSLAVVTFAAGFYRWRQRRWRALARRHLAVPRREHEPLAAVRTVEQQARLRRAEAPFWPRRGVPYSYVKNSAGVGEMFRRRRSTPPTSRG